MNPSHRFAVALWGAGVACLLLSIFPSAAAVPGDEHWDSQFGPVGTSDSLYATAVVAGKVYAGGYFTDAGNNKASFVAGYNGTNWFPLNNGVSGGVNTTYVFALAGGGSNLYVGGWFTNADNTGARNLARWDGNNWSPLAGGSPQ